MRQVASPTKEHNPLPVSFGVSTPGLATAYREGIFSTRLLDNG